ncbi:amylo-alpha-1,6-glucosidase [Gemmata sp.]|uniref:amylo-alpha-1,6-glucosidase n=1 Tax=Gemmata sp. TaxID=1914242 RepID=UPI003F70A399
MTPPHPLPAPDPREWLVTNGLGGYASGTVSGAPARRYHGLLVAAHPAPLGRLMLVNNLRESLRLPGHRTITFSGEGTGADPAGPPAGHLVDFRLDAGLPVWRYAIEGVAFEKRVFCAHRHNTVYVRYRLTGGAAAHLELAPSVHFRGHDDPVDAPPGGSYDLTAVGDGVEVRGRSDYPVLRMMARGGDAGFTVRREDVPDIAYPIEESRGYAHRGALHAPGFFRLDLEPGRDATLVFSTELWDRVLAAPPDRAHAAELDRRERLVARAVPAARSGLARELVLAADQFLFTPARSRGAEERSVIAGYHWFTDWGRDTMIGLEGLTLVTGRHAEAGHVLRTFAGHVRDGLIPNLFPETGHEGLYHTADATLWFFHALNRYVGATGDRATLRHLLPTLKGVIARHVAGTRFGIGVDPADGLLRQGAGGYQLTWMDAKVGDWVVTPRRGKAVEINALWYNALRIIEGWVREEDGAAAAAAYAGHAERCRASFNRRFWYAAGGHLYDVLDGPGGTNDPALRPNQVFAISLDHPVLDPEKWEPVLRVVRDALVTPVGLRSLAPGSPDYQPRYAGDIRARDAAYHQGTVWAWLIGPYLDAHVKAFPSDRAGAAALLDGFRDHVNEACVGSISEVFDAEPPHAPRGCVAQAWSVAEVLRCSVKVAR